MKLIGHDNAWQEWRETLSGPRMHHGWILAGKRGLGKMNFAMAAARELVAEPGIPQPALGNHPDILTLTNLPANDKEEKKRDEGKPFELKRNISVAQIRGMQKRLVTRPTLGNRRVIIIDPSDDMEKGASNALLKSLEEPPNGTFFLLIAHSPAQLLPTIRSRCRILRFPSLEAYQLEMLLAEHSPQADAATREAAIAASGGSPGVAIEFVAQDLGRLAQIMHQVTESGDTDFSLRGLLAGAIGARPNRVRIQATLDLARSTMAQMIDGASTAQLPVIAEAHSNLVRLAGQAPTYNFDPGLLAMEIGTLLASAAPSTDRINV